MNIKRFLLTTIAVGALAPRFIYGAEPGAASPEKDFRGVHATDIRPGDKDQIGQPHSLLKNNGPLPPKANQAVPIHAQAQHAQGTAFHQQGLNASAAANKERMIDKTGSPQLAKSPGGGATAASLPTGVRGKGAVPASVGGGATTALRAKNSMAVLNGTDMKRRP